MKAKAIICTVMLMACSMANAQIREAAVLFSDTKLDNSYLLTENVSVTFDSNGNGAIFTGETKVCDLDVTNTVTAEFKDAFKLKANQNPDKPTDFYSTFYTSEGAYKVPSEAKAYAGEVETGEEADVLKMTDVGSIIHKKEAVILRANQSEITLMPSCNKDSTSTKNALEGTDKGKTLTTNQYALSLGQYGVGFYLWSGKSIGANKAYLTLENPTFASAFTFQFEDEITDINNPQLPTLNSQPAYNLNGVRVNDSYKGIVIKNGKKIFNK